jgi:hypothetical protein
MKLSEIRDKIRVIHFQQKEFRFDEVGIERAIDDYLEYDLGHKEKNEVDIRIISVSNQIKKDGDWVTVVFEINHQ